MRRIALIIVIVVVLAMSPSRGPAHVATAASGGRLLFAADWSRGIADWNGTDTGAWHVHDGFLTSIIDRPSVLVPPVRVSPGMSYSIEALIRVTRVDTLTTPLQFGVAVRASLTSHTVRGLFAVALAKFTTAQFAAQLYDGTLSAVANDWVSPSGSSIQIPGSNVLKLGKSWHVMRVEVRATQFSILWDGHLTYRQRTADRQRDTRLGILSEGTRLQVATFTVRAL